MRAPRFIDSDNTAYYGDFASTSNVNVIAIQGGLDFTGGTYIRSMTAGTSYQQHIQVRETNGYGSNTSMSGAPALGFHWSGVVASNIMMEASGRIAIYNNPGTSYENFIANNIYFTNYLYGNNKQALDTTDSYLRLNQSNAFTNGIYTPYNFRADGTIYVGGTTYYINSSTSNLNNLTLAGGVLTIAKNGTNSYINFNAQSNDPGYIRHYESSNTSRMFFNVSDDDGTNDYFAFGYSGNAETAIIYASGRIDAPIFYDRNNTGYYLDPASTTFINDLELTGTFEMGSFGIRNFTLGFANTSNQKANLEFDPGFWGWLEVEATCDYNYANRPGRVAKRYYLGLNPSNAQYANESRIVDVGGPTRGGIAFGDVVWTGSRYRIVIANRDNAANTYHIKVTVFTAGTGGRNLVTNTMTLSGVYTSDGTAYPDSYIYFNDNIGFGTSQPGYGIHVNRNQNQVAAFQSPNANTWIDIISTSRTWSLGSASSTSFTIYDRGTNTTRLELTTGSDLYIGGNMYAYRFYDRDNTGYYTDPASDSQFNTGTFNGRMKYSNYLVSNNNGGLMGDYNINSTASKVIWTIGESWPIGNMYGLGYEYGSGYDHHLAMRNNGTTYSRIGFAGGMYISGDIIASSISYGYSSMRSPIFYDYNNTGYYADFNDTGTSINVAGSVNHATYNKSATLVNASGTSSAGAAIAIQQVTPEGWTAIFADFEPYTGWGLYHDNPSNTFGITAEDSTNNLRSYTVPSRYSGNRTAYEKIRFDQASGHLYVGGNTYASAFYDRNDTAYYLDPNGTSNLGGLTLASNVATGRSSYGQGTANLVLLASSTYGRATIDFRSGVNYPSDGAQIYYETAQNASSGETSRLVIRTENDADDSILIRGGYVEVNTTTVDGGSTNPGFRVLYNGSARTYTYSDNTTEFGSFRAPIFYDSNNTAYFCDPNGRSRLSSMDYGDGSYYLAGGSWGYRHNTPYGYIEFGPANSGHAHIYTNLSNFYFNVYQMYLNGVRVAMYDYWVGNLYLGSAGNFYATIFYDSNNSGYYCDPDGTNRLNFVNSNNHYIQPGYMLYSDHGGWQGEYNKIQWHSSHMYFQNQSTGYFIFRTDSGAERAYINRSGDLWLGYLGWMSNHVNQSVRTDGSPTFANVYVNDWFRQNTSNGMYWQPYGRGFRSPEGAGNSYGHVSTYGGGRSGWYGWGIDSTHCFMSTTGDNVGVHDNRYSWIWYWDGGAFNVYRGYTYMVNSARSPIFYDSNDTSFYFDGNGTTRWQGTDDYSKMRIGLTGKGNFRRNNYTGDSNYWIGSMGWGTEDLNNVWNWGSGFFDTWSNPGNQPPGTSHWVGVQAAHYTCGYGCGYGWQLASGPVSTMYFRNTWSSFTGWRGMLDSGNYSNWAIARGGDTVGGRIYFQYDRAYYGTSTDSSTLQAYTSGNNGAFMSYHKGGYYAINLGLDGDNVFRLGGWSSRWPRMYWDADGATTVGVPYILRTNFDNYGSGGLWVSDDGDLVDLNDGYLALRASYGLRIHTGNRGGGATIALRYDGQIIASNNIIAYGSPSDIRLKENIKPLENSLEKVMKMRGVEYDWKEGTDEYETTRLRHDIGFIAQEVGDIIPDLVRAGDDGYLAIRDRGIPAILLEAIKELKAELDETKKELKELKEKMGFE